MPRILRSHKKQKLEAKNVTVHVSVAVRALNIVLQQCMMPELGWKTQSCERYLEALRVSIASDDNTDIDEDLLCRLEKKCRDKLEESEMIFPTLPSDQVNTTCLFQSE